LVAGGEVESTIFWVWARRDLCVRCHSSAYFIRVYTLL